MKKKRQGFTLVEVTLFLAVTGLLFISVAFGLQNSISQQRYNDSVQGLAEFLRTEYSKVSNVQGVGSGNSDYAIYGRLIVFGEKKRLDGSENTNGNVYSYDVIGKADSNSGASALSALAELGANLVVKNDDGTYEMGLSEEYIPRWGAAFQPTGSQTEYMHGAVLIVRHPASGTVNTYTYDESIFDEINNKSSGELYGFFANSFNWNVFDSEQIDVCVNPSGNVTNDNRRDIRIIKGARNSSGVETIELDKNEVVGGMQIGNRCRYQDGV